MHSTVEFKSSPDYLQYLIKCKHYINSIYIFIFVIFYCYILIWGEFLLYILHLQLVESAGAKPSDMEGQL